MSLPVIDIVVDGVSYKLTRMGALDALRFDAAGSRILGPLFRALAGSDDVKGLVSALTGADEAKIGEVLTKDVGAALAMLGLGIDEIAEKIDPEALVDLAQRMCLGRLVAPHPVAGMPVLLEKADDYDLVIGLQMSAHGHMHQLKLLWAGLRANLGPTSAGSPSSTTTPKASPA